MNHFFFYSIFPFFPSARRRLLTAAPASSLPVAIPASGSDGRDADEFPRRPAVRSPLPVSSQRERCLGGRRRLFFRRRVRRLLRPCATPPSPLFSLRGAATAVQRQVPCFPARWWRADGWPPLLCFLSPCPVLRVLDFVVLGESTLTAERNFDN